MAFSILVLGRASVAPGFVTPARASPTIQGHDTASGRPILSSRALWHTESACHSVERSDLLSQLRIDRGVDRPPRRRGRLFALAALALLVGAAALWFGLVRVRASLSTLNFNTFSQVAFDFRVTPGLLLRGLGWALVIGLAGGLLPAVRAARIPVTEALRTL